MKNFSIIALIFVIPLVAYMILTKPDASFANKAGGGVKAQVIKFASPMCLDCKKMDKILKELHPKYEGSINFIEIPVQNDDEYTKGQIEKYNVTLVPTMIFVNTKGQKVKKIEGYIDKDELEKIMKDLING
ncbi:MAG TPA: thioredoxin family protein [Candidatus Gastranaerophilaceae bacterium]|nr:thioredoxin family protein [Candidatus Gastranaerophilaceae bacterium]